MKMRLKLTVLLLLSSLVPGSLLRAAEPTLEFAGKKYELATVQVDPNGSVINEYVPVGETIDTWTTLVAVRQWPQVKQLSDATEAWMKVVSPLLTKKTEAYQTVGSKHGNDMIFEAWLASPDHSFVEIDLQRFVTDPGMAGVKAYSYSQKIPMVSGKGSPAAFSEKRLVLFTALAKLEQPAIADPK